MSYNPIAYWNKRKNPNRDQLPEEYRRFLEGKVPITGNVIDYGCGVGRTFSLYPKEIQLYGIDITSRYAWQAKLEAKKQGIDFHHFIHHSPHLALPMVIPAFESNKVNMILAIDVLLHVPSKDLQPLLKRFKEVSDELIIISYFVDGQNKKLAPHNFEHDYPKELEEAGYDRLTDCYINDKFYTHAKARTNN